MSDLSKMIDDTTERLLRKIDNWEVPQSDKEYVTIEKEVWESTLKASMDREGEIETLQKQLDIAVKGIKAVLNDELFCEIADGGLIMYLYTALERIEDLNK